MVVLYRNQKQIFMIDTDTKTIFDSFVHEPTECQSKALFMIEEFLGNSQSCKAFILRGSAGTGKTSLMQAVVSYLKEIDLHFVLLAPTGRAAKILGKRVNDIASTIHHQVYIPQELPDGKIKFTYRLNESNVRTIFIVDEASMLASENQNQEDFITPNSILHDLLRHIKEGNGENQVIFIGDTYQLPPVSETESTALSARLLSEKFDISAIQTTLQQVMRQKEDSPILRLANDIKLRKDEARPLKSVALNRLRDEQAGIQYFLQHFDSKNLENIICIANSNKKVQELNEKIRKALGFTAQSIMKGDVVMLHQNYAGNVSKGDMGVVLEVGLYTETVKDLTFVDVEIDFDGTIIKTKALLDCLLSEYGVIDSDVMRALKGDRMAKNEIYRISERASDDPYMGAIHLRYGYAITCHKAQGSEWKKVLIEPKFYLGNQPWLYTAVTRASETVSSWWYKL